MSIQQLLSRFPATAVLAVFLTPGTAWSTAAEDSLQAALNGPVSPHQRSQALLAIAQRHMDTDPVLAHDHAASALRFAEQSGDAVIEHQALLGLAEAEERIGLFTEFMKTTFRSLELAQTIGDPKLIAGDLHRLSKAYMLNGMPEKGVVEARNALAMLMPTRNGEAVANAQRVLLHSLLGAGEHKEVLELAERYIDQARANNDALEEARLAQVIGATLMDLGKMQDASTYLALAERQIARTGTNAERFSIQCDLVEVDLGLGRTADAARRLEQVGELLHAADCWTHRYRSTELKYRLAMAMGRWHDALGLLQQMKERSDSANHARLDVQMARMQTLYQLERQEKVNAVLRNENAKVTEKIAGTQLSNRVLIGILAVLSVLVTALFFTSRQSIRLVRRMGLKNALIKKQHDEIHAKNLELQRQNMRLAETLVSEEQKEMIIKEIHHRVKNNLQVVDSLLQIQGAELHDPLVGKVLKDAQGRIRSMALVHDLIYRSANGGSGELQKHFEQLARNILAAYGAHDRISVSVNAPLPVFPTETMIPLTLLVNELFTRSVKHAFQDRPTGHITIVLRGAGDGYELLFSDDGVGAEKTDGALRDEPFGMQLVNMLAVQMNGELRSLKGAGTAISLTFDPEPKRFRIAS